MKAVNAPKPTKADPADRLRDLLSLAEGLAGEDRVLQRVERVRGERQ
eukprot:CAMPEP_0198575908 /NCGR_PEP_ID=MMETSP1462-20131121/116835_1 /TAXON_ID=1333877 /ORGANISM="Brandtodinium nutriculum, Strain RCC3387" /LENGTH=46 /DNA_ID= /DNA_START= /DNA_END= /DNA_ORIENTATION=